MGQVLTPSLGPVGFPPQGGGQRLVHHVSGATWGADFPRHHRRFRVPQPRNHRRANPGCVVLANQVVPVDALSPITLLRAENTIRMVEQSVRSHGEDLRPIASSDYGGDRRQSLVVLRSPVRGTLARGTMRAVPNQHSGPPLLLRGRVTFSSAATGPVQFRHPGQVLWLAAGREHQAEQHTRHRWSRR